uniref:Uncharacterized protein n=1 Tax=Setaria italica TaxID=4555 RepID=K4ANS2_SETIT
MSNKRLVTKPTLRLNVLMLLSLLGEAKKLLINLIRASIASRTNL